MSERKLTERELTERELQYNRDYHKNIRRPKTLANRALAAATCEICGDEWANTQAGWNDAIFACNNCAGKLSKWDREKEMAKREMDALCQNCYIEPSIGLHEASQFRCCVGCLVWLSEGEAEGSQRWKPSENPWDTDGKLGHLFESVGAEFHEPPAVASLCGVKAPIRALRMDMTMPSELRRWGLCVACLQACPDPAGLAWKDRNYFAYVIPAQTQETAPAVGTS